MGPSGGASTELAFDFCPHALLDEPLQLGIDRSRRPIPVHCREDLIGPDAERGRDFPERSEVGLGLAPEPGVDRLGGAADGFREPADAALLPPPPGTDVALEPPS